MTFIIQNGEIVKKEKADPQMFMENESFSLSQKIWFGFGGIPLFAENMQLFDKQLKLLNLPRPKEFTDTIEMMRLVKRMLNKNKFYLSGYIYLHYSYTGRKTNTLITSRPLEYSGFPFSQEGLLVSFSDLKKFSGNQFNRYLFFNRTLWNAALAGLNGTYCKNSVILNENDMVCECAFANIFMLKGTKLITPSMSTGCYEDTLRNIIIEAAESAGIEKTEEAEIHKNGMKNMDELFIAGEQTGISRIIGVEEKRFLHHYSPEIYKKVNKYLEEKVN
jgi:branched-subunit amino acid aminotransferase/4-amino-4-deoxychorismate lyase